MFCPARHQVNTPPLGRFSFVHTNLNTSESVAGLEVVLLPAPLVLPLALPLVLPFGVGNSLPLHIARCLSTMTGNRYDVGDHVALAGPFA